VNVADSLRESLHDSGIGDQWAEGRKTARDLLGNPAELLGSDDLGYLTLEDRAWR